jgi:hypothetical protein
MIFFTLHLRIFFLKRIRELSRAEYVRTDAPLVQNPQKISESAIRKHCSSKNPFASGRKPCRLVFQQCVLANHHSQRTPSVNKIACRDALQIHSHTHPSFLIPSPVSRGENPKAMDKGKQPQESSSSKKRTIRR